MIIPRSPAFKDPKLRPAPALNQANWGVALHFLDTIDATRLLVAIRTLYPHDGLDDPVYRRVVAVFDRLATQSPQAAQSLDQFGAALEAALPLRFVDRSEGFRVQALKSIEHTPAFRYVQRTAVRHLYDDLEVWAAFGYEGASWHLGGYANRGFDDLDWLPPIPVSSGDTA